MKRENKLTRIYERWDQLFSDGIMSLVQLILTYRWGIGILLWIIFTVFQLHGSSIGLYAYHLEQPDLDTALFGINRQFELDEWDVFTPFVFSQYYDTGYGAFSYINDLVRAAPTEMALVFGQPCWDFITLFRPFLWGYLFLSPGHGLAFYWYGRVILLFLISYEMGLILSNGNKRMALIYALLVAYSPMVQWWIATNSFVEMLIFGQAFLFFEYKYLLTVKYRQRLLLILLMAFCIISYCLSLYPAWQISFGYIFCGIAIWIFVTYYKSSRWMVKDVLLTIILFVCVISPLLYICHEYWDIIQAFKLSEYPGKRYSLGGSLSILDYFNYIRTYIAPYDLMTTVSPLNYTTFLSFAPMGIAFSLWRYATTKKVDFLSGILIILVVIFECFCLWQWPIFLAKVTLLISVPEIRLMQAVDFAQVIIFVRELSLGVPVVKRKYTLIFTALYLMICGSIIYQHVHLIFAGVILICSGIAIVHICRYRKQLVASVFFLSFISAILINPIARGTESVFDTQLAKNIQQIVNVDKSGKWIVDGEDYWGTARIGIMNNYPIMFGAPTINTTNLYPYWPRWEKFQVTDREKQILNRTCYMNVHITDKQTEFQCPTEGQIIANIVDVRLNIRDLKRLDVRYILSSRNLEQYSNEDVKLSLCTSANGYKIYSVT